MKIQRQAERTDERIKRGRGRGRRSGEERMRKDEGKKWDPVSEAGLTDTARGSGS